MTNVSLGGIVTLCGLGASLAAGAQQERPNILMIQVDQQRYDCMEMTGSKMVNTPRLKRLAEEGMFFTHAFTPIPTSCPARQCLLTGVWPEQHKGLWNYDITFTAPEFRGVTWTEAIAESGYTLGYVGKWHVHPSKNPRNYGFSDYVPEWGPYEKWRKERKLPEFVRMNDGPFFGGYDPVGKDSTKTHWMAGQVVELMKKYRTAGKPWHIRMDLAEPHLPCFPAKEFYDLYDPDEIPQWKNFPDSLTGKPYIQRQQLLNWGIEQYSWDNWKQYVRRYWAMISQVDDAVGIVLDALKELGLDQNTIVIYTTDHGDAAGSHGMIDKHYVMYEEEVHVPLIVRWPGVVEKNSRCHHFVIHELDLAATFAQIAGVDFKCQGESLVPLLKGEEPVNWRQYAFSNYNGQQFGLYVQRMVRDRNLKYVWNMTDTDELYDLKRDPYEMHNLIREPDYREELMRLRKVLYHSLKERKDPVRRQDAVRYQLLDGKKL